MAEPAPMLRLLQGDVGSGKTLVAALAMARAAEAGLQSAMMAPTDLLARQHGATLEPLLAAAGITMAVLTGRDKAQGPQGHPRPPGLRRAFTSSSARTRSSRTK